MSSIRQPGTTRLLSVDYGRQDGTLRQGEHVLLRVNFSDDVVLEGRGFRNSR